MDDDYKRIEMSPGSGVYQCGCHWERVQHGDILRECIFHHQATVSSVREFDRDNKYRALENTND